MIQVNNCKQFINTFFQFVVIGLLTIPLSACMSIDDTPPRLTWAHQITAAQQAAAEIDPLAMLDHVNVTTSVQGVEPVYETVFSYIDTVGTIIEVRYHAFAPGDILKAERTPIQSSGHTKGTLGNLIEETLISGQQAIKISMTLAKVEVFMGSSTSNGNVSAALLPYQGPLSKDQRIPIWSVLYQHPTKNQFYEIWIDARTGDVVQQHTLP